MTDTTTTEPAARDAVMGDNSAAMDVKAMVKEDPKIVFRDTAILLKLLAQIDKEIAEAPIDLETKKGRDEIRTRAADIGRLKTMLDKTGLALTEDFRKQTKEVNDVRNEIKDALSARDDKAREKLTEWEKAEDDRQEKIRDTRAMIERFTNVPAAATLADIEFARGKLAAMVIDDATFGDLVVKVTLELDGAYAALTAAEAKIKQAEADKLELARLRQQEADRQAAERQRIANEEAAKAKQEAEERIRQEAADKAAADERDRQDAIRREELRVIEEREEETRRTEAAERKRLQDIADEARRETARLENEAAERDRIERERVEEEERRLHDRAHRARIIAASVTDLMEHGNINEATANAIVQAVAAGSVRHMKVEF